MEPAIMQVEGATCAPVAPTLALSPALYRESAGQTLPFQITLTNQDGPDCGPTDFVLAGDVPAGWTGRLAVGQLGLAPGETGSTTFFVTAPVGTPTGDRTIAVAAADQGDPGRMASAAGIWQVIATADTEPPSAPGNLAADTKRKHVVLSWRASRDDVGVTGYRILRNGVPIGSTSELRFTDRPGVGSYTYTVVAHDATGNTSAPSNAVQATIRRNGRR
jgi:hypothetical protein